MSLRNVQNQEAGLVLSIEAKPRLKWTPELHQRFIDAVNQLGGPDKATPKSLKRVMGIHGLTLYHLKSHLQKFRLGKSQQPQTLNEKKTKGDYGESQMISPFIAEISDGNQNIINESTQIANALQMQMEVQRKLYEQIEVQKRLQFRIEAQGKYLQSVLQKAQETLAGYNASTTGVECAKAGFSQLVWMVDIDYPNSSLSGETEIAESLSKEVENKQLTVNGCSVESSLTSSESSGRREISQHLAHESSEIDEGSRNSVVLPLMDMQSGQHCSGSDNKANHKKRNGGNICVEKPLAKRLNSHKRDDQVPRKFGFMENLDLNSKCLNDFDSGPIRTLDLNCEGVDQPNGYI